MWLLVTVLQQLGVSSSISIKCVAHHFEGYLRKRKSKYGEDSSLAAGELQLTSSSSLTGRSVSEQPGRLPRLQCGTPDFQRQARDGRNWESWKFSITFGGKGEIDEKCLKNQ